MKDLEKYIVLFDCYRTLLTEKEQSVFSDYYEQDLSIGEIATNSDVSRSAIHKCVKTVIEKLNNYEANLHMVEKNKMLDQLLIVDDMATIKQQIEKIIEM